MELHLFGVASIAYRSRDDREGSVAFADGQKRESSVKKSIKFVVVCGAPLLAAGIALPSASADPTNTQAPEPPITATLRVTPAPTPTPIPTAPSHGQ